MDHGLSNFSIVVTGLVVVLVDMRSVPPRPPRPVSAGVVERGLGGRRPVGAHRDTVGAGAV